MADPSLELQRALRAQLLASPAVTALVGQRIYDQPPITPQFPYITLGETDVLVQRASFYDGSDVSMSVHAWSRANGYPEGKRIAAAIRASLHEAPITLVGLERLVDIEVQSSRAFRDPDGLTSHAVITVRALTEPVNEEGDLRLVGAAGFQAQGASTRAGALALAGSAALQGSAPTVSSTASAFAGSSSFVAATGGFYPFTFALTGGAAFQPQATAIRSTALAVSGSTTLQARVGGISPAALTLSGGTTLQARAFSTPPTITSSTTQTVAENSPFSLNLTASEVGTWAITGGADAAMFEIAGSAVSAEALDFELPEDANHDNIYDVQVTFTATATGLTDTKTFHLTVTDIPEGGVLQLTGRAALAFVGQVAGAGPSLSALTLSANTIVENSVAGTLIGAIVGQTAGSTLTLIDNAGNRFALQTVLEALTLSANALAENSIAGTVVGTLVGQTAGSTITLTDNAGGRFGTSP